MSQKNKNNSKILIGLILVINLIFFVYSVNIRQRWFGKLASSPHDQTGHHQWLTASTIVFTKNWIKEGPLKLKLAMLQNPLSVETVNNRAPYGSYPPGTIIPIYLLAKITNTPVSPGLVMTYNLSTHFLLSLTLSLIVFYTLKRFKIDDTQAVIASLFPTIIQFLLPHPLYFHQNSYFSDQAVILPYVLFILLEIIRFDPKFKKHSRKIKNFQLFVNIWGLTTDWLFVFINFFTYIKRLVQKQIPSKRKRTITESFYFWLPTITVVILFLFQVFSIGAFQSMKKRFILRVGLNPEFADYQNKFISYIYSHLQTGFGKYSPHILFFSVLAMLIWAMFVKAKHIKLTSTQRNTISTIMALVIFTPITQIVVFRNHSAIHDFSVLKLSVFLSIIPFAVLPTLLFMFLKKSPQYKLTKFIKKQKPTIYPKILLLLLAYSLLTHNRFRYLFPESNTLMEEIGNFVNQNTDYHHIVFSSDITVKINPPQMLSYTEKRIYQALEMKDILKVITPIKDDYTITILEQVPSKRNREEIENLKSFTTKTISGKNANLYFIDKKDFWEITNLD